MPLQKGSQRLRAPKSLKNRIIALSVGVTVCLLVTEIALRILGAIYAHISTRDGEIRKSAGYTILCVGDSFTFGLGAPRTESYPAQLERLLNAENPDKPFVVINRGRPGQNSAQLLAALDRDLKETMPDLVLVMAGGPNLWNYWGYQSYKQRSGFVAFLYDTAYRIRLFKLIKLLYGEVSTQMSLDAPRERTSEPSEPAARPMHDEYSESVELSPALIATAEATRDGELCLKISRAYMDMGDHKEALKWLEKGKPIDPMPIEHYLLRGMAHRLMMNFDQALYWFKGALTHPGSRPDVYHPLAEVYAVSGKKNEAIAFFEKESALHPSAKDFLTMFASQSEKGLLGEVKKWVEDTLDDVIALCRQIDADIIIQGYPLPFEYNRKQLTFDDTLQTVADKYGLLFVDHGPVFSERLQGGTFRDIYLAPDGHPNTRGYGIMAASIHRTLMGSDYFKSKDDPPSPQDP